MVGCIECNKTKGCPTKISDCECSDKKWAPENCVCGMDNSERTEKAADDCTCGREVIPQFVALILVVRQRIKNGAKEWIGYQPSTGQYTGNMSLFISNVKKSLQTHLEAFVTFVENNVTGQKAILDCFEKDPNEEERERLLRQEELVLNAIREVNNLG